MDFISENRNYIIIIVACLMLLIPILLMGCYDRPIADDWDYGLLTHDALQNGGNVFDLIMAGFATVNKVFNGWSGLYTSAFIQSFEPGIFGESIYGLTCIIVLSIAFIFLFFSMRILNKHYIKESNIFVFTYTLLILTIITLLLPSALEGIYWYNGAMNYMPWVFSNFLAVCILIEIFYTDYNSRRYFILLGFSTLLAFITSGGNHVTGLANILILLISTIFLIFKEKKYYSVLPLLVAIIGYVIVYTAPGTAIRQTWLQFTPPSFGDLFINTFYHEFDTILSWLNYKWLLSLILVTPISLLISKNIKDKLNIYIPIFLILCSLFIIGAMFALPYYTMGNFGPHRLENVVWIFFLISSWAIYTLIIGLLEKKNIINFDVVNSKYFKKWFIVIMVIALFSIFYLPQGDVYSNSYICLDELNTGIAEKYAIDIDDRINYIKSSNQDEIKVKPITSESILHMGDLTNDPEKWPSTSWAYYFHKKAISSY